MFFFLLYGLAGLVTGLLAAFLSSKVRPLVGRVFLVFAVVGLIFVPDLIGVTHSITPDDCGFTPDGVIWMFWNAIVTLPASSLGSYLLARRQFFSA